MLYCFVQGKDSWPDDNSSENSDLTREGKEHEQERNSYRSGPNHSPYL
jgi:hypothetical protein